jgi:CTD kinase subunit alpha
MGAGSHTSIVYRARARGATELVALKSIKMETEKDGFPVAALREIRALQRVRHPHVLPLRAVVARRDTVFLVLEYMEHDLAGILSEGALALEEDQLKTYMLQLLEALACLHAHGIVHRDLKGAYRTACGSGGQVHTAQLVGAGGGASRAD